MASKLCVFCNKSLDSECIITVKEKGLEKLFDISKDLKDNISQSLNSAVLVDEKNEKYVLVHKNCRLRYLLRRQNVNADQPSRGKSDETQCRVSRRSQSKTFDFKQHCFYCAEVADVKASAKLNQDRRDAARVVCEVRTTELSKSIIKKATERGTQWDHEILTRLGCTVDLVADEGRYHKLCHIKFGKLKKATSSSDSSDAGRPIELEKLEAFNTALCCLECSEDDCEYSLGELYDRMKSLAGDSEIYTERYFRDKLKDHYGSDIVITDLPGRSKVICLKSSCDKILHSVWSTQYNNDKERKSRVIYAAAAIIIEEIRSMQHSMQYYEAFDASDLEKWISPHLIMLLKHVIKGKRRELPDNMKTKVYSIAHAVTAAARPRSFLSSLQVAVGAWLHRRFGSRLLIDLASRLGFCINYAEVQKFTASATMGPVPTITPGACSQFVWDNADINQDTLTGRDTFHSMGGIMCVTPATAVQRPGRIPRLTTRPTAAELTKKVEVPISVYTLETGTGLRSLQISRAELQKNTLKIDKFLALGALHLSSKFLFPSTSPSWTGHMILSTSRCGPYETSSVILLPFIMLTPTNKTAIKSALEYGEKLATQQANNVAISTFDQPLYHAAMDIVLASQPLGELTKTVVHLGGFHTAKSFLGAVGHFMQDSGIQECMSTVYAPNSVKHILEGGNYARGIRAHFLLHDVLAWLALDQAAQESRDSAHDVQAVLNKLITGEITCDAAAQDKAVKELHAAVVGVMEEAASKSRTSKLWLQYFDLITLLKMFIYAERTGDWELHLYTVRQMIPYFLAAGHLNYARSSLLYVQSMLTLGDGVRGAHDEIVQQGYFTIRRSSRFWSGIWTDLTIEQTLMRMAKSIGGMSGGRGISESTLHQWTAALPASSEFVAPLETLLQIKTETTEQHVDFTDARQRHDFKDLISMKTWLADRNPFTVTTKELTSLSTGLVAPTAVNCDMAQEHGERLLQEIYEKGESYAELRLQRKARVTPQGAQCAVKFQGELVKINSEQLLLRMNSMGLDLNDQMAIFGSELASTAPSLFYSNGHMPAMHSGKKSGLQDALFSLQKKSLTQEPTPTAEAINVVDGGYLLHKCVWPRPATFDQIIKRYTKYLVTHFGPEFTVVFDSYSDSNSTKSSTHELRYGTHKNAELVFTRNMHASCTQADFLKNPSNKTRLIDCIVSDLRAMQSEKITAIIAEGDADSTIAATAIISSESNRAVNVHASDTDILVILIATAPAGSDIKMISQTGVGLRKVYDIARLQGLLGASRAKGLLFIHAVTGCDTTSFPSGRNKKTGFNLLKNNTDVQNIAVAFTEPNADPEYICASGEKVFLALYDCMEGDLNTARYYKYHHYLSTLKAGKKFNIAALPPTSDAAKYHILRTYLQVQQWLGRKLAPEDWGFQRDTENVLRPIVTRQPLVPENLLQKVSCNCAGDCSTKRCGCKRLGANCTVICHECRGLNCANNEPEEDCSADEDEDSLQNDLQVEDHPEITGPSLSELASPLPGPSSADPTPASEAPRQQRSKRARSLSQ